MKVTIPYTPRPLQKSLHNNLKRFNVIVCHRRFGKTVFCINEVIRRAMINKKRSPVYAYIAPTIKQAKGVTWKYWKHYTSNIPGMKYNESELRVKFPNGAEVIIGGAENPDSLRGFYWDGIILDEVAQMPKVIWTEVIRPALSDRLGWAIFIGTPKGQNYFYELYENAKKLKNWYAVTLKASETAIIPQEELDDSRIGMGEDKYDQEYECSFTAAIKGTYYAKLLKKADAEDRIKNVLWDPSLPVITAWDLGVSNPTVIWFVQNVIGEVRVIDYYEATQDSLTDHVNLINSKPYTYENHILPHDVKVRSMSTGKTRHETLLRLGLKHEVAPKLGILEGITAVKMLLPHCYFDKVKCSKGLIALRNYRSEFNEKTGTYYEKPAKTDFNDAADAFRYLAISLRPPKSPIRELGIKRRVEDSESKVYDPFDY